MRLSAANGRLATMTATRVWSPGYPLDLGLTLGPLLRGKGDPTQLVDAEGRWWRACRTPEGVGTLALAASGPQVHASAWGPGADWLLTGVPDLLGVRDAPED